LIEERGCELLYLPPYSPDLNLIEEASNIVATVYSSPTAVKNALERMSADHPHLREVHRRPHLSHDADPSILEEWRQAPEGSEERNWADHRDEAMGVLAMSFE
jgi:hypothetical protein